MIKLLITDDQPLFIMGLQRVFEKCSMMQVTHTFTTLAETIATARDTVADILLLGINESWENISLSDYQKLLKDLPHLKIIILSHYKETQLIDPLLKCGLKGYALKNITSLQLKKVVRQVMDGQIYLPIMIEKQFVQVRLEEFQTDFIIRLTNREKEILHLILEEMTSQEIAQKLYINIKTVESHRKNLLQKTGARNIAGLVRYALENKLLNP